MNHLLLTLGHNSSAILIRDGQVVWGFETERISGVKSDSRFPMPFIASYLETIGMSVPMIDMVYVTHWDPSGVLSNMGKKYWDPAYFDGVPIRTLSEDRTHHDTHIMGAIRYAGSDFPYSRPTYGLVIDGFGIHGEHLSIYKIERGQPMLVRRVRGYNTSLGLWYQYATAFMGMKMHEDEYKLLGYEVHVPENIRTSLVLDADVRAAELLDNMRKSTYGSLFDPMYNLDALAAVKNDVFGHLTKICSNYEIKDPGTPESRAILAFYVQAVLEAVMTTIVGELGAHNLILSGGVFYNVKLNRQLISNIPGKVCVYPLAGDQGNALGLYAMDHPNFVFPSNLNWGLRNLRSMGQVANLTVCRQAEAYELVRNLLRQVGYVNLVRGSMEFGPRAMCNTSTLAVPFKANVHRINAANNRNTVMPMAPVLTRQMYVELFERTGHVWKSEEHMITALEYREAPWPIMEGVAHEYNYPHHHHTGRPQVVDPVKDPFMHTLLTEFGHPLINTSFNFHGMPIALGMESIIANHMMQYQRDNTFHTVVIQNV